VNTHLAPSNVGSGAMNAEDSSIPGFLPEDRKVSILDDISSVPITEAHTIGCGLNNVARTFVDSVLSLCRKSEISCGDSVFIEEVFLGLVKECGFVEAKCWAEALHIPHDHAAALLSALLLGPRRQCESFVTGPIRPKAAVGHR
jgi:hypothetical protein